MNIFLVSNMYPSQASPGFGVFVKNVCTGLEESGIHTLYKAIITGRGERYITKIEKYLKFYVDIVIYYFREYDFLYLHFPNHAAPILIMLIRLLKKRIVVNYHGEDLLYNQQSFLSRFLGKCSEKLVKDSSFIIVPSEYYKKIVIEKGLAEDSRIVVSPSGGIDTTIFQYKRGKNKKEYFHLGYVGRLEKDKGILEFIEACFELSKDYPIKSTIIGYGELDNIVEEKVNGNSLFTLKKGVPQAELPAYYNDFDLFYFPSSRKTESLGLVGIEAMACGTPVLGGDIGGIKSYIRHGENGFLLRLECLTADMIKYSTCYFNYNNQAKASMIRKAVETASLYSRQQVCEQLSKEFMKRV